MHLYRDRTGEDQSCHLVHGRGGTGADEHAMGSVQLDILEGGSTARAFRRHSSFLTACKKTTRDRLLTSSP